MEVRIKKDPRDKLIAQVNSTINQINSTLRQMPRSEFKQLKRFISLGKEDLHYIDNKNGHSTWFDFLQIHNTFFIPSISICYAVSWDKFTKKNGYEVFVPTSEDYFDFPKRRNIISKLDEDSLKSLLRTLENYLLRLAN